MALNEETNQWLEAAPAADLSSTVRRVAAVATTVLFVCVAWLFGIGLATGRHTTSWRNSAGAAVSAAGVLLLLAHGAARALRAATDAGTSRARAVVTWPWRDLREFSRLTTTAPGRSLTRRQRRAVFAQLMGRVPYEPRQVPLLRAVAEWTLEFGRPSGPTSFVALLLLVAGESLTATGWALAGGTAMCILMCGAGLRSVRQQRRAREFLHTTA